MPFTGDVVVREVAGHEGSIWRLVEPLRYDGRKDSWLVDAGFETDFASVPQWLTWLVPKYGRYTKAAILHDFLCDLCLAGEFAWADADGVFRRVMRELKVPLVRRWLMWAAVRLSSIARHDPRSFLSQGFGPAVKLVLIVVGAVAFLATPIVLVVLFSLLFAGLEALAWVPLWLGKRHGLVKEQVNRPRLRLPR